jgi:type I restriction enzyme S subunit
MPEELPKRWVKTTLGEIAEPSRERALPAEVPDMPYVGLEHIEPQTMKVLVHGYAREARSSSVRFSKGDVLYGKMRPYLNKVWVAEFDGLCSAEFLVFSNRDGLSNQFLALRLNAEDFVTFANGQVSGERPRVDFEKLSHFPILLPPTAEQQRIVAKLDAALSGLERAEKAARRAQERLQRYRAAVLHGSVTGELTRPWRESRMKNKKAKAQTGEALLQRLLAARRSRWEQVELQRLRAASKEPKDDKWKSRYVEPVASDTATLPELPEKWAWASLDMIAEIGSGISVSKNRVVKNPVELPYLRVANVLRGNIDLTEVKTIRVEKERVDEYLLEAGDILFNEGGDRDKLGRGWIWEGQIPKCVHQNHVFRARLIDQSLLDARLVSHWGNTFGQNFFLTHGKQTTNLASINRAVLSKLPVPIPPIAEQSQIIREVERRIAAADRLAAKLKRQLERKYATRESLLREAFSGRLVPQDRNDEPASVLLNRIRAASKAKAESKERRKMPRRKKQSIMSEATQFLDIIRHHYGNRAFTFDNLRKEVREYDYEQLKNELFVLLRPTEVNGVPALQTFFNAEKERMEFKLNQP